MMKYVLASVFLCIIQVSYIYATPATNLKQFKGIIPANFVTIGNETFYVSPKDTEVNNLYAAKFCNDDGMKLVSFETEEKWLRIAGYMGDNGYSGNFYWTSGRKFMSDFQWTGSGKMFSFQTWNAVLEEPNTTGEDVCVWFFGNIKDEWLDDLCSTSMSFICEF